MSETALPHGTSGGSRHGPDCGCRRCVGFLPGNRPANFASGVHSEHTVAPLRVEMDAELARDYPGLDERRRALLADRLARVALARAWVDDRGIVRDEQGRVFDVVDRLEKWSNRAESILAELEGEAPRAKSLVVLMQERAALGHGRPVVGLVDADAAEEPPEQEEVKESPETAS